MSPRSNSHVVNCRGIVSLRLVRIIFGEGNTANRRFARRLSRFKSITFKKPPNSNTDSVGAQHCCARNYLFLAILAVGVVNCEVILIMPLTPDPSPMQAERGE